MWGGGCCMWDVCGHTHTHTSLHPSPPPARPRVYHGRFHGRFHLFTVYNVIVGLRVLAAGWWDFYVLRGEERWSFGLMPGQLTVKKVISRAVECPKFSGTTRTA